MLQLLMQLMGILDNGNMLMSSIWSASVVIAEIRSSVVNYPNAYINLLANTHENIALLKLARCWNLLKIYAGWSEYIDLSAVLYQISSVSQTTSLTCLQKYTIPQMLMNNIVKTRFEHCHASHWKSYRMLWSICRWTSVATKMESIWDDQIW